LFISVFIEGFLEHALKRSRTAHIQRQIKTADFTPVDKG